MSPSPPPATPPGDSRPSPTVSVIIPALNQAHSLALVLTGLPPVHEVIVVDGGSDDDTVRVARATRPGTVVLRQTRSGKGNALACGFAASSGDIVVTLNSDGSTDPGEIPRFVDALLAGAEIAHGSRYYYGGGDLTSGRLERLGNAALSRAVAVLFGTRLTDLGSGYNAFWRSKWAALDLPGPQVPGLKRGQLTWGDGPEIVPLVNIRMAAQGLRVVEVASVGYPSIHGDARRRLLGRTWRALHTLVSEYLRMVRHGRRSAPPRHEEVSRRDRDEAASRQPANRYSEVRSPATDPRGHPTGEPAKARHALPSRKANTGQARSQPTTTDGGREAGRPESLADHGDTTRADRRRGYPGPRPPWAPENGGAHRTQDIDYRKSTDAVYGTGVHHTDLAETGGHRSGLYDTGVRRVGTYDSGVHRTDVYESGVHDLPDDEYSPLYRQGAVREVGGGRRRLDAEDRRADGRPDLTIITGEGDDNRPSRGGRSGHLQALPGKRFTR